MKALRIIGWDDHYESNESRKIKRLEWVRMPNSTEGSAFCELLTEHANGLAHFGAWMLLVRLGSRCPVRGLLVRSDGRAYDVPSMARQLRAPVKIWQEAIDRFVGLRWAEWVEMRAPGESAGTPGDSSALSGDSSGPPGLSPLLSSSLLFSNAHARPADETPGENPFAPGTPPPPVNDRELIRPLATWVRWKTNDPEGTADNVAELAGLIRQHGAQKIEATARELAKDGKIWPDALAESLRGAIVDPEATALPDDPFAADPRGRVGK